MDESIKEGKKETQKKIKAREEKKEKRERRRKNGKVGRKGRGDIKVRKGRSDGEGRGAKREEVKEGNGGGRER